MSDVNVQLNNGPSAQVPAPITVGEALKKLDRDLAKQALAARVNGREVDLAFTLDSDQNGNRVKDRTGPAANARRASMSCVIQLRICSPRPYSICFREPSLVSVRRCSTIRVTAFSTTSSRRDR